MKKSVDVGDPNLRKPFVNNQMTFGKFYKGLADDADKAVKNLEKKEKGALIGAIICGITAVEIIFYTLYQIGII